MEYGDNLTLKEAAEFAEVSEVTMRAWVKEIANIKRYPGGGYAIPKAELMAYLGVKETRKVWGGRKAKGESTPQVTPEVYRELIEELRGDKEGLKKELTFARERVKELESQVSQLTSELMGISREMRELVFGGGQSGLSSWIQRVRPQEPERAVEILEPVPEVAAQEAEPSPAPSPDRTAASKPAAKTKPKAKPSKVSKAKPSKVSKAKPSKVSKAKARR